MEDQRLVGVVETDDDGVQVRLDAAAGPERFRTVALRERAGDRVLRAVRRDGALVGRVGRVEPLDGSADP
jgi:hypothetical protein